MEYLRPDISVLVATRNRGSRLERMLLSIEARALEGPSLELIVIDNGSQDDTQSVLKREWRSFTLVTLYEGTAGKSRALNCGLEVAAGNLLVFTDDDIIASPIWLRSLYEAFEKYSSAAVFCGPIVPIFPPETPEWMRNHGFASSMFGKFEPNLMEGPLPAGMLPFGANFAVRSSAMRGRRFRLDLGPSKENGQLFGEDTEFVGRFQDDEPQNIIFAPAARVDHYLTPAQIATSSLMERAFHHGRESAFSHCRSGVLEPPRYQAATIDLSFEQRIERWGRINYHLGQLYQLHLLGERASDQSWLEAIDYLMIGSSLDLLGESAYRFYCSLRKMDTKIQEY